MSSYAVGSTIELIAAAVVDQNIVELFWNTNVWNMCIHRSWTDGHSGLLIALICCWRGPWETWSGENVQEFAQENCVIYKLEITTIRMNCAIYKENIYN